MRKVILDTSDHQGNVDFTRVRAEAPEVVGAIIKATEGPWPGSNPNFDEQYASARAAGLAVGFYCFDHTSVNAADEAQLYLGKVAGKPAELGHWFDFEANDGGLSAAAVQGHVSTWLTTVDAARVEMVGVYSAPWAWDPWTGQMDASHYPLWLAGYTASLPPSPAHWGTPLLWQFTDSYPCYFGGCDASVFLGTDAQWAAITSGSNPVEDDLTPAQDAKLTECVGAILQLAGVVTKLQTSQNALAQSVIHGDATHYSLDHLAHDMATLLAKAGVTDPAVLTALGDLKTAVAAIPAGTGGTVDPTAVATAVAAEVKTITWKAS